VFSPRVFPQGRRRPGGAGAGAAGAGGGAGHSVLDTGPHAHQERYPNMAVWG